MFKYGLLLPIVVPLLACLLWEGIARYTSVGCVACRHWETRDRMWTTGKNTTQWMEQVSKCPCTVKEVHTKVDIFLKDHVPALHQPCTSTYNVSGCTMYSYRTRHPTVQGAGNQCCYDAQGALITGGLSAGTIDRFAPVDTVGIVRHVIHDVLPFIACCSLCRGNCESCDLYTKRRRPLHSESGCKTVMSDYVC